MTPQVLASTDEPAADIARERSDASVSLLVAAKLAAVDEATVALGAGERRVVRLAMSAQARHVRKRSAAHRTNVNARRDGRDGGGGGEVRQF